MPGIPQNEFTAEIADYIRIFINAMQGKSEEVVETQAKQCATLITSLARGTTFEPFPPLSPEERARIETMRRELWPKEFHPDDVAKAND